MRLQLREFVAEQFGNGYFPFAYFTYMMIAPVVFFEFGHLGKAVISPSPALLAYGPMMENPSFRICMMLDRPCKFLSALALSVALARLTERIACMSRLKQCLLVHVMLLVLVIMGILHLERTLFTWLWFNAPEACVGYSLFLAFLCTAALAWMGRRAQTSSEGPTVDVKDL